MKTKGYQLSYSTAPGAQPTVHGRHATLRDARRAAKTTDGRSDLNYQDVRIERPNGALVEYSGPVR